MSGLLCEKCDSGTKVVDSRCTPHPDTPIAARRAAMAWGGIDESWQCRRRVCSTCFAISWTIEMPMTTLMDLMMLVEQGKAKNVVAALQGK
jgi:hypothetical protein